ncbi:pleiotropic drug resistance ABC transporter [Pisolithus croceorrhizus]|nr:pleiotropic drug resistance ABC transporter [Pisolithus croceorrhizus]KAI6152775.1 pleiotropic drug resistance ABC transporter [Pisolithus thermaeus]
MAQGVQTATANSYVDVQGAEETFNELIRQLSKHPQTRNVYRSNLASNTASVTSYTTTPDVEKGKLAIDDSDEPPFDLREYLTSSNDANQAAGIQHKHVGVTWDNLEVNVIGGVGFKAYIPTFGDAVMGFFMAPFLWLWGLFMSFFPNKRPPTRTILHKSSGVLKPGEMCLVLGCPGAGCTTFLKTIANYREDYASVSGVVLYAGINAEEMAKYYRGEVVYNQEDDIHIATLTVAQTLDFALSTKTPGPNGRLPGMSSKEFRSTVQDVLLKMLNIPHTRGTLVGNAFVRGVSGGERKRVSIAEMMATRARVQCWDNSTRGLDASTALDFVKSLRIMTDVLGQTTFVTLYQASESIYELFDKVLVLDKGHQVYFGPPSQARAYFEGLGYRPLPRQSTPDYLTGCTDPNECQFADGHSANNMPSSPEGLEVAFRKSPIYRDLQDSCRKIRHQMETEKIDQEAFRAAVLADKQRGVSKKSPYTLGFSGQVKALTIRQFRLRRQDRFQLVTSFTLAITLALVIGGAYFNLSDTAAGAFTRGGVVFLSLLTVVIEAFAEMPLQMLGRPIVNKQTSYGFYRPAAVVLANFFADIPIAAVRVFIFDVTIYFMTNLARSAGGFWTFHLFVYTGYLAMQGFFRTLGLICANFDSAFRLVTLFLPNMMQYTGYTIPMFSMKRWLSWIYYINPLSYSWGGVMENEFMRTSYICDGDYVVPRNGPGMDIYPNGLGANQVCTLFGAQPGSDVIPGKDYLEAGFALNTADIWRRNLVVIVAFIIFFLFTQVVVIELFSPKITGTSGNIFAKENAETKRLNVILRQKKAARVNKKHSREDEKDERKERLEDAESPCPRRKVFTWENLNYHVPVPGGTRRLLHDVCGYVKPGTLTALMGASGAGKTTCLDVLAQRKNIGVVTGDILVDGRPLGPDFARGTAYAEQMDVHEGTATVREALRFSAYLRQPADVPIEEKDQYVEEIIELLELQDLTEALVFSLSVEARKRLTIGVELASKPALLLFLDEPTSGLDGQSAWNLVRFLRKLADQGQAILCTIHQPSSLLFESFDRLLLLESGGETVYFGDIGKDSRVIRQYFARNGAQCPSNVNPAEYMLEAIGAGLSPRVGPRDWKDVWLDSPEYRRAREEINEIKAQAFAKPIPPEGKTNTYATSFLYQLKVVVQRNNIALWRSPDYVFSRLFVHALFSLCISLSFIQLGNSIRDLQYRVFGIYWLAVLPPIVMTQLMPVFILNRLTFIREASSRIYSPYVFAIAQLLGEVPYSILCATVYWVLMVYPMGFGKGATGTNGTGFQLLVAIFIGFLGVSLGQLLGSLSPSIQIAVLFVPFIALVLAVFCGVTIPYPSLIPFWRDWLYRIDPFTRMLSAMLSTELHGLPIVCSSDEFAVFNPPSNQTCFEWAGEFVSAFGGYLNNPNATVACQYCQYKIGDEYLTPLNISFSNRWRDVFILFAYFVFNIIATIIASRFLRYARR